MAPYLHVLVLAAPIAVVGGLVLSRVRRAGGVGNDWWSWVALAGGLTAIGGALVTGVGAIEPWLETTVHRVTEFAALAGWWIVAMWAVVAAGAPSWERERRAVLPDGTAARPGEGPDGEPPPAAVGGPHGEGGRMDPGPTAPEHFPFSRTREGPVGRLRGSEGSEVIDSSASGGPRRRRAVATPPEPR
jgi:hypothetical protein